MKKTTFISIGLVSLICACGMDEKTDAPSHAGVQELDVSQEIEQQQKRIRDFWDNFDESREYNEIFFAIMNAENGDTIVIQPGTYWGAITMIDKHDLTLDFSNVKLLTKQDETLFKIIQCSNIKIQGLTLFHDPKLAGCFTNCFDVDHSHNITFSNCDINGSGFIGVCINQCSRVYVQDCKIHECQYGVFVWGNNEEYGGKRVSASHVFIENCVFEKNNAANVSFDPNYARATEFRIQMDSMKFSIDSVNMKRFLTEDNTYEVGPKGMPS